MMCIDRCTFTRESRVFDMLVLVPPRVVDKNDEGIVQRSVKKRERGKTLLLVDPFSTGRANIVSSNTYITYISRFNSLC